MTYRGTTAGVVLSVLKVTDDKTGQVGHHGDGFLELCVHQAVWTVAAGLDVQGNTIQQKTKDVQYIRNVIIFERSVKEYFSVSHTLMGWLGIKRYTCEPIRKHLIFNLSSA